MDLRFLVAVPIFVFAMSALPARAPATPSTSVGSAAYPAKVPENPAVTDAARTLFEQIVQQRVDRTKLTAKLNKVMTDSTIATVSRRLKPLGRPTWIYLRDVNTSAESFSVYKLRYPALTLYLEYGASGGKTSLFLISARCPRLGDLAACRCSTMRSEPRNRSFGR